MSSERRTIIVSGGGIAGLAAALALSKSGFRVELFEKAEGFELLGAGIQLSPNAMAALDALGQAEKVSHSATAPDRISIYSAQSGSALTRLPLGDAILEKYSFPWLVIHRADLHSVLLAACNGNPDIGIHLNSSAEDVASHPNGVTVLVRQGDTMREVAGHAMVVADGVWSRIRQNHFGLPEAAATGLYAWRALVTVQDGDFQSRLDETGLWLAPGSHCVIYPVRRGRYLNIVAITKEISMPVTDEGRREVLKSHFRDWHPDFSQLMERPARWTPWPIHTVPHAGPVSSGNVLMLGDASNAMLPFAAQGAAMALEDAASLIQHLARTEDPGRAFSDFCAERVPRVRKVAKLADQNRGLYHFGGPASIARNAVMKLTPAELLLRRQDWIYRWRP